MINKITLLTGCILLGFVCSLNLLGQINYTAPNNNMSYPNCDNNYGAGETATITTNTMALGDGRITLGGVANVIGHFSTGGNAVGHHNSTPNTAIYTPGNSSCHGSIASSQTMPAYSYCSFWNETHKGTHWMYQNSAPTYTTTTTVRVAPGYTLSAPLALQQYYFLDIPWYYRSWRLYTYQSGNLGCCGIPCLGTDTRPIAAIEENTPGVGAFPGSNRGGYVNGHVIVDAGSHIRLTSNAQSDYGIGAGNHPNSTATVTFPAPAAFVNYSYSTMIDGTFRENTLLAGAGGAANNINPLAEHAVFGIQSGYYPGAATKMSTHAAGGTILIGSTIQGQDKMEITTTTSAAPAGGFTASTVYTGTDLGVIGTANLGNYANNAMNIAYSATLFGPTSNNVGTSAMQIYNHSCNPLRFYNNPLTININNTGYFLVEGYQNVVFDSNQALTATNTGRTTINGGNVHINAGHAFVGSAAPTTATDMYYSVNAYRPGGQAGMANYCGAGNIITGGAAVVTVQNSGDGHSLWYADANIQTGDGVYFINSGTGTSHWHAIQNITSNDTVQFDHSGTAATVTGGWIKIESDSGNITANNWFDVAINNPSRVSILATNILNGVTKGNISFRDSLNFLRMNNTTTSMTEIIAGNHIRTAMVNYESLNKAGDSMRIISRMGDIWLGYNNTPSGTGSPASNPPVNYDNNIFTYIIPQTTEGKLLIRAGDDDPGLNQQSNGGNIYFTHINENLGAGGLYNTEVSIPFSNWYNCNLAWNTQADYEMAGIIGGVKRCAILDPIPTQCSDTGLIYKGFDGELLFDAGTRGNIIINNGSYLNFQDGSGHAKFLTRWGDIDMRYPFDTDSMMGSLLFLAQNDSANRLITGECGCVEKRNNVYLQDFQHYPVQNSGSVFVGADNNIKLQYGGLKGNGLAQRDPFFNNTPYPCGTNQYHCDSDTSKNKARDLILNFYKDAASANIQSGGFAAVASDLIDVYKNMIYNGGIGSGMSTVPVYNSLHGESVAGYGLYIKTQANKDNWNKTDHGVNQDPNPTVGAACDDDQCNGSSYLHQVARVTFHSDARIYTENQRSLIASPVLETYGNMDLNTNLRKGGRTSIQIKTDSLIIHDSLILDGKLTKFSSWSELNRSMPVFKFGHQRFTPPVAEDGGYCAPCYAHEKDMWKKGAKSPLDTIFVTFRNGASVERLHTLVADHAILSFLTDSFDHVKGDPTINATFYADTFKIRNHVELFRTTDHTHDGHFELVSEPQMKSKAYAGVFSRHLHMEPIAPACTRFGYSQMWQLKPQLNVVTTSTFGGFGWLHSDVHVEIGANLFPGYASLQKDGNCYEQKAGILKMEDLRLDKGANLKFSLGEKLSEFVETHSCFTGTEYMFGGYADCLDVDSLSIYGEMFLEFVMRPEGLDLVDGESRCFPIIRYKSVGKENLNNLRLKKDMFTSKDHPSIIGTYYLNLDFDTLCNVVSVCVATIKNPIIHRRVEIPSVAGVTTNPPAGIRTVKSGNDFRVKIVYTTPQPLKVMTGRSVNGAPEEIWGWLNPNGEYEYTIHRIIQDIKLSIGPDIASPNPGTTESLDGVSVWSNDQTIYVRVKREDIATIYSVSGQLVKRVEVPEGETLIPMHQGVYVVTLKDGSVHKVIVK